MSVSSTARNVLALSRVEKPDDALLLGSIERNAVRWGGERHFKSQKTASEGIGIGALAMIDPFGRLAKSQRTVRFCVRLMQRDCARNQLVTGFDSELSSLRTIRTRREDANGCDRGGLVGDGSGCPASTQQKRCNAGGRKSGEFHEGRPEADHPSSHTHNTVATGLRSSVCTSNRCGARDTWRSVGSIPNSLKH